IELQRERLKLSFYQCRRKLMVGKLALDLSPLEAAWLLARKSSDGSGGPNLGPQYTSLALSRSSASKYTCKNKSSGVCLVTGVVFHRIKTFLFSSSKRRDWDLKDG
ncbi:hypothetical protein, partial [Meiothermus sp. QL-1]|uniref:hypothetical protein n=1 Tax=Meiothermus sp. QL-1 TaxID=2058095 RepID=UPI001F42F858